MKSNVGGDEQFESAWGDGSTEAAPREAYSNPDRPTSLPTLTILAHPDLGRVGERAVLGALASNRRVMLARGEPHFQPPDGGRSRPLADRFLSRAPVLFRAGAQLRIERKGSTTSLEVEGVPLEDVLELPLAKLDSGVLLVLGGRVALLLHRARVEDAAPPPAFGLVGASDAILDLRRAISRVADLDVPVLVRGPTGTGKELVARALHEHGPNSSGPFVAVNLGALAPSLAVAELFGAKKGAFTGAVRDQPGRFAQADGGTLFLDEIGEAPAEVQVMLLRVLETGEVTPLGAHTPHQPRVRLVSATDAALEAQIEAGTFREPLLHRLAGYRLEVPPLDTRREDVARLLVHFLRREYKRLGEDGPPSDRRATPPWLDPVFVARLTRYNWPGNVRELRNVARELVIDSRHSDHLVVSPRLDAQLPRYVPEIDSEAETETGAAPVAPPTRRRKPSQIGEEELYETLRRNRFDLKATAQELGVSRTGLYARLERSPRVRSAADVPEEEIRRAFEEHGDDLDALVDALEISERALRQRLKDLGLR